MARPRNHIRDFPGKRWLNLGLRTLHIGGLVLLGAALLGKVGAPAGAMLVVASGLGMFAIDTWANPAHLREIAGFGVLVKLLLVALMAMQPDWALTLFWVVLVISTILSHAPAHFRHRQLF